jgi:hypothetical protein
MANPDSLDDGSTYHQWMKSRVEEHKQPGFCKGNEVGTFQDRDDVLEKELLRQLPRRPKASIEAFTILKVLQSFELTKDARFAWNEEKDVCAVMQNHYIFYTANRVRYNNMAMVPLGELVEGTIWYDITCGTRFTRSSTLESFGDADAEGIVRAYDKASQKLVPVHRQEIQPLWSTTDPRCNNDTTHCFQVRWDDHDVVPGGLGGGRWIVKSVREMPGKPGVVASQLSSTNSQVASILGSGIGYFGKSVMKKASALNPQTPVMVRYINFPDVDVPAPEDADDQ